MLEPEVEAAIGRAPLGALLHSLHQIDGDKHIPVAWSALVRDMQAVDVRAEELLERSAHAVLRGERCLTQVLARGGAVEEAEHDGIEQR